MTGSVVRQVLLLEESWKDLFLLQLAQWYLPFDLSSLLDSAHAQSRLGVGSSADVRTIQDILCRFRQLSPDMTECGCLRAIVLFKPGQYGCLRAIVPFKPGQ